MYILTSFFKALSSHGLRLLGFVQFLEVHQENDVNHFASDLGRENTQERKI
jgi:hypothetical protein